MRDLIVTENISLDGVLDGDSFSPRLFRAKAAGGGEG